MKSHVDAQSVFAPAPRADEQVLKRQAAAVTQNPILLESLDAIPAITLIVRYGGRMRHLEVLQHLRRGPGRSGHK